MSEPLVLALPSKGRLKEQAEAWLADCGLPVRLYGGERGYAAALDGLPDITVRLLSAAEIADSLFSGDIHLGVTGEDLLRERSDRLEDRLILLRALGFGRADLVVAAPKSWIDVDAMADVDEVAHLFMARTGRRLRVATKYLVQSRAFFARHGVTDYRIVESGGATEGAPAAGTAELVVDITTTGATLAANGLKVLADGVILKSQAQLAASLAATWDEAQLEAVRRLCRIVEARARALGAATLAWPAEADVVAREASAPLAAEGASPRPFGLLVDGGALFRAADLLASAGVGPVSVSNPAYVFEPQSAAAEVLAQRVRENLS
jgi:ATP phosphoribosyltransferase